MPDIYAVTDEFRRRLLRQERAAAAEVAASYSVAWARVKRLIDDLLAEWEADGGASAGPSWTYQYNRLRTLEAQIAAELQRFSEIAMLKIATLESYAATLGAECAAEQLMIVGRFNRLPDAAVQQLAAALSDQSPLRLLLERLPADGAKAAADALIEGMALGQGVNEIARNMRAAFGQNLTRALRVARTETLRAYREATRAQYAEAGITQWEWRSARNERTCAVCWAMDGKRYNVSDPMPAHVNCRCVMLPVTPEWSALGFTGVTELPPTDSALSRFAGLTAAQQLMVLGRSKFALYRAGGLDLNDLVGMKRHPLWGWSVYEKSLSEIS